MRNIFESSVLVVQVYFQIYFFHRCSFLKNLSNLPKNQILLMFLQGVQGSHPSTYLCYLCLTISCYAIELFINYKQHDIGIADNYFLLIFFIIIATHKLMENATCLLINYCALKELIW